MKYITGIGSRETPADILDIMRKAIKFKILDGFTLRSGGADGADTYCAYGWGDAYKESTDIPKAEIYLPWNGFNGLYKNIKNCILVEDSAIISEAHEILKDIHPAFDKLTRGPLALHTRNCFQVLGADLRTPSNTVLCYAKQDSKGNPLGGTATAINLARLHNVRVVNLSIPEHLESVMTYLEGK